MSLFDFVHDVSGERVGLEPVTITFTDDGGRFSMCLPAPRGDSGGTDGQTFQLEVRKSGYLVATQSFTLAYSVWDYHSIDVDVEVRRQ